MPASLLRPAPLALCTSWRPSRRHASLSSSRSGVGDAAQHLAAAAPLQCRWPLACRQPAMQLHSRRATLLARCSSSSSSSSSSSHGSGPPPPPPLLPHSSAASAAAWPAAWLQRAFAGAALSAAALLMAARPAAAAPLGGAGSVPPPPMPPPPAAAAAQLTEQQQAQQDGERQQRGWRDTGMLLAAKEGGSKKEAGTNKKAQRENGLVVEKGATSWMSPEEAAAQSNAAVSRLADAKMTEEGAKLLKRQLAPSKGGKLVKDPTKSTVPDPSAIPSAEEFAKNDNFGVVTAWRPEKLKEMTYTQFWNLVRERKVDHARYSHDRRTIYVTTKANAPGGVRTEKVGLPFDPDLYDHLLEHGVFIEDTPINPVMPMLHAVARLVFPIFFSFLLIKFAFRLGRKKKRDKIFGGAKLEVIKAKDATVTFKDIAGIDQVKDEIMEIVSFLRDPQRFLTLGARSPAGVLLVGAPGTGKTLLAKAVAGEAGVPFFSIAGTEFMEMFTGVGASRVRDMFQQARKNAPCILFIDEFDGVGKARSFGGGGNDESVHTINQLLTEMDGFEDNTGVVVMAATNRPSALDKALTRPGRFDRIVHLPLPNVEGRVGILKVHARDKKVDPQLDFHKISRATAGFTGAQLMNLMNQSAILAVRQQQPYISEKEVFEALEKIQRDKMQRGGRGVTGGDNELVPLPMRRSIAVYEAGRALMGYLTPNFDEIQRVSVCPGGGASGYTYFLPREEALESRIVTKGYMEARMVVSMAGRCAERLVLGEGNVSTSGASDIATANRIAREMIFRCGFSKRLGPVSLMTNEENYLKSAGRAVANISTELAIIAYEEVEELVEAAEAKAYYGLAVNYRALTALAKELMEKESMTGAEVRELLEREGVKRFDDTATEGYGWTQDGALNWPGKETKGLQELSEQAAEFLQQQRARELAAAGAGGNGAGSNGSGPAPPTWWAPNNPYTVRTDIADLLGESKDN